MRSIAVGVTLAFATLALADAPKAPRAPGAVVVAIDRSLTMHGPGLDGMKAAALATAASLAPGDQLAVVAFDRDAEVVVPLQRPTTRARLARALDKLRAQGGTNLYAGLAAARDLLGASTLATKHVILMTDGDAPADGLGELVAELRARGVTLSILGLPSAPPQHATCCRAGEHAHRTLMSMLAKGSGRLYFVDDPKALAGTAAADTRLALE